MIRRPRRSTLFPSTTLFRSTSQGTRRPLRPVRHARLPDRTAARHRSAPAMVQPPGRLRTPPLHAPGQRHKNDRSEEHTSELQSRLHLVCRLLLEKKKHSQINLPPPIVQVLRDPPFHLDLHVTPLTDKRIVAMAAYVVSEVADLAVLSRTEDDLVD